MMQEKKYNKTVGLRSAFACFFVFACLTNELFAYEPARPQNSYGRYYEGANPFSAKKVPVVSDKIFYVGVKGQLNFVNHGFYVTIPSIGAKNEKVEDASVSMGMQTGFELNIGKYFTKNWRSQLDVGMLGRRDEKFIPGTGLNFFESASYATLSGIYSTKQMRWGGVYAGFGGGIAMLNTGVEDYMGAADENSDLSPMGALMFGYEKDISDNVTFDIGIKSSIWYGNEHVYDKLAAATGIEKLGTGMVWNNALMVGIRCKF